MLHSMKKSMAKATASKRGVEMPAEFQDLRKQLEIAKKNVKLADNAMDDARKAWLKMMISQRNFTADFSAGYPRSDGETAEAAAEFAAAAERHYDHFVRESSEEDSKLAKLRGNVKAYLEEVGALEKLYTKLVEARTESARYQAKLDTLAKKKKDNDVKKSRNFEKLDAHRASLEELTAAITKAQKQLIAKSETVHKMAMVAYWHANEMHLKIATQSMEKTSDFADKNMEELLAHEFDALDLDNDMLANLLSVPKMDPISPPTSPRASSAAADASDVKPSPA